ncbi:hypothetical protein Raf01_48810 [Rugosimonospora africana]|uniref:Uncharacterized protein n=1 Tax=Rugosimonospora africana TaxID=556532 RepID=A0A8J3QUD6_9ACTN|nr:hypothetical protein Raf01_48810 [Rugosimonospora africana]
MIRVCDKPNPPGSEGTYGWAHVVHGIRTARAAVLPIRVEHEVVHDELTAALEQIAQTRLAGRTFEHVVLVDPEYVAAYGAIASTAVRRRRRIGPSSSRGGVASARRSACGR